MIIKADGLDIYKEIQTSQTLLIDCWAPWCPPCKMLDPILEEIHEELGLKMVKVNADDNEEFISTFQVLGLPTLLLFRDNELVKRITGFHPKESLIDLLTSEGFVEK